MDVPDKSGLYIFLGIIVVLITIAGIVFWKWDAIKSFVSNNEESQEEQQEKIVYKEIKLYARDKQNKLIYVDYEILDNTSQVLQTGSLKENIIEIFKDAVQNKTYFLKGISSQYYSNSVACTLDQETCTILMDKIADIYINVVRIKEGIDFGVMLVEGGIIVEPILCIKWEELVNIDVNLSQIIIPSQYYTEYDKCYTFNQNLTNGLYNFMINYKPIKDKSGNFELELIDYCSGKYIKEGCAPTLSLKVII